MGSGRGPVAQKQHDQRGHARCEADVIAAKMVNIVNHFKGRAGIQENFDDCDILLAAGKVQRCGTCGASTSISTSERSISAASLFFSEDADSAR